MDHYSKEALTRRKPPLYLVAHPSQRTQMLQDDWLVLHRASHQAVLPCVHAPSAEMSPRGNRQSRFGNWHASIVGDAPGLLPSNPLVCEKRARWLVVLKGSRVGWPAERKWSVSSLMQNCACGQMALTSPGSDRVHVRTLDSLLLSVRFPVVLPGDSPAANVKAGRLCRDQ